jgi:thiamine biosynthesis lipoprotein
MTVTGTHVETSFRVMGSSAHVVVVGARTEVLDLARRKLEYLESVWSRFIPTSEISVLNRDTVATVSAATCGLIERMIEAWYATGGRFDPTMGGSIAAIGYDRPFADGLDADGRLADLPSAGCENVIVDCDTRRIAIPPGVAIDPGGMGKGYAADLVAHELIEAGAVGVLVNVGGDLKVLGESPTGGDWRVEVTEPTVSRQPIATLLLPPDAALATSTPLRRTWRRGERRVHHLLDPRSGMPYDSPAHLVSVVAADAWWAEATTKQLIGASPDEAGGLLIDATALMVTPDGVIHLIGPMQDYLA